MENNKRNLKIELRAVPYGDGDSHVLEYRFSPNQDLRYYKEYNWFWGLIKFGVIKKYSTSWHQPVRFFNGLTSYRYNENNSYSNNHPIFVNSKRELADLQQKWQTYGQFIDWYWEEDEKQRSAYRRERNVFLEKRNIWN